MCYKRIVVISHVYCRCVCVFSMVLGTRPNEPSRPAIRLLFCLLKMKWSKRIYTRSLCTHSAQCYLNGFDSGLRWLEWTTTLVVIRTGSLCGTNITHSTALIAACMWAIVMLCVHVLMCSSQHVVEYRKCQICHNEYFRCCCCLLSFEPNSMMCANYFPIWRDIWLVAGFLDDSLSHNSTV